MKESILHDIVSSVIDMNMTDYEEKINIVKRGKFYYRFLSTKVTYLIIFNNILNLDYFSLKNLIETYILVKFEETLYYILTKLR